MNILSKVISFFFMPLFDIFNRCCLPSLIFNYEKRKNNFTNPIAHYLQHDGIFLQQERKPGISIENLASLYGRPRPTGISIACDSRAATPSDSDLDGMQETSRLAKNDGTSSFGT